MILTPYDVDLDRNAGELPAADADRRFSSARRRCFPTRSPSCMATPRRSYAEFYARAQAPRLGAGQARHRPGRHRLGDARQHARHARMPLRRADDAAACSTRSTPGSTPPSLAFMLDHAETKVLIVDREFSAVMAEALALAKVKPLVIDYDDPDCRGARARDRLPRLRDAPRGGRSRILPGQAATTNGTRSRSTTPRARPAIPRASSITIAAPI